MNAGEEELDVVRAMLASRMAEGLERILALLADDVVLQLSDGRVYVGHDGYVHWFKDRLKTLEDAGYEEGRLEYIGGGWVLVVGSAFFRNREGEKHIQPGAWLVRVRNGKVASVHYYRAESEARAAVNR